MADACTRIVVNVNVCGSAIVEGAWSIAMAAFLSILSNIFRRSDNTLDSSSDGYTTMRASGEADYDGYEEPHLFSNISMSTVENP